MLSFNQFVESFQRGRYSGIRTQKQKRTREEEMEIAKIAPLFKKVNVNGWRIEPSVHAAAQSYDRRPDLDFEQWMKLHNNMIDGIERDNPWRGEYVVYSMSMRQAYVVAIDPSRKNIRIITVLPRGKNRPNSPSTEVMFVEGVEIKILGTIEVE